MVRNSHRVDRLAFLAGMTPKARQGRRRSKELLVASLLGMAFLVGPSVGHAAVCGNGVTEPGEQCDVADTASGLDECDGCATDCTLTEECGPGACSDDIDNDNNSVTDEQDPKCASLFAYNTLALLGTSTAHETVRLGTSSRIRQSELQSGAEICTDKVSLRSLATVDGSVTAVSEAVFSHGLSSGIRNLFVTSTGTVPPVPRAPVLVGDPIGTCGVSGGPCISPLDCADYREECKGRLKLNATNPAVDLTGTGIGSGEYDRCVRALNNQATMANALRAIGNLTTEDNLSVRANGVGVIDLGEGTTVLSFDSVRLTKGALLTINGSALSGVVIRVNRALRVLNKARIELTGGITPGNVLWIVEGVGPTVLLDKSSSFQGFIWAPNRSVRLRLRAEVTGAIVGSRISFARSTQLEQYPLQRLLPSVVQLTANSSPNPVTSPGALTYNLGVTNNGPAWTGVANVVLALDSQTTFAGATTSQGRCLHDGSPTGGTVSCYLGSLADPSLAPANQASVQVSVNVAGGASTLNATATLNHYVSASPDTVVPISTTIAP